MSNVVLLTGVTRGIGAELVKEALANASNAKVIVGVRDVDAPSAKALAAADAERVIVVKIDSTDDDSPFEAAKELRARKISAIDVVFANAGVMGDVGGVSSVSAASMRATFQVNAIAPLLLFQALKPFLQQAKSPRFLITSTLVASNAAQDSLDFQTTPYNASKVAVNMIGRRMAKEEPWLTTILVHPGMVADTDMAIEVVGKESAAELIKAGKAITSKQSAESIWTIAHEAKQATHSGQFLDAQAGGTIPW